MTNPTVAKFVTINGSSHGVPKHVIASHFVISRGSGTSSRNIVYRVGCQGIDSWLSILQNLMMTGIRDVL
jgi:hypothetical protein